MRSITRMVIVGAVAGAVAVSGVVGAVAADDTAAAAGAAAVAPKALTDDDTPPPAVEDFVYPNADQIFADRGIRLKSGDGHIVLDTCAPGMLEVDARNLAEIDKVGGGRFCFKTTGTTGRLTLELPSTYAVSTNAEYSVHLVMVTGTETKIHDLKPGSWNKVGELTDPQQRPFTLLELTTSK
ncbi:hypothetical protein ACFVFS_40275 [Kitasatospora sp. NPDC057692]|uniref:hypothetical protein n=1 Tax=Kitasatospora sp. NPDC057692 TaxID=3346215 RepID=UPI00369CE389